MTTERPHVRPVVAIVTGSALLIMAVTLPAVVSDSAGRMRWEAARQLLLVLPGTILLAWSLATLRPGRDPLAPLGRLGTGWFLLICALVVVALSSLSSWHLLRGGPFVPGDEDEYLFQARVFARGRLWWEVPDHPQFFMAPGQVLRANRLFGHHQWGHSLVLALGVLLGQPRFVPVALAALSVLLCHSIGRELGGEAAGRLSAVLLAVSPFFWFTMGSLVSETTSMFALLLATALLLKAGKSWWAVFGAGWCLGLAVATRALTALAVGFPLVACWLRGRSLRRALLLLLGALPLGAMVLVANRVLTGRLWTLPFTLYEENPLGFSASYNLAHALGNLASNVVLLNFWLLGWPLGLVILGACIFVLRRDRRVLAIGLVVLTLGIAYMLYWHRGQVATGPLRFFEACPFLVCVVGAGLARLRQRPGGWRRGVGWGIIVAIAMSMVTFVPGRGQLLRAFTQGVSAPSRIIRDAGLSRAVVFLSADHYLFSYPRNDLDFQHPHDVVFARDLGRRNAELMSSYPGYLAYLLRRDEDGRWRLHHLGEELR